MKLGSSLAIVILCLGYVAGSTPGPYAPAAEEAGSTALPVDDPRILSWAGEVVEYVRGARVSGQFADPLQALGAAILPGNGDIAGIVSLGAGGQITLSFANGIRDGDGFDFAVFENSFSDTFLELAFVEVSSNGRDFVRAPSASLTDSPVGAFGLIDTRNIDGLAGKFRSGFGTPFDLADFPHEGELDKENVRFVRLIDIIGDGSWRDSTGRPIYDPYPTIGSAGFDLDAIAVLHEFVRGPLLLFDGATEIGEWLWLDWFGFVNTAFLPWLFHSEHGWLYLLADESEEGTAWLWDDSLGWLWVEHAIYPSMWSVNRGWLWYERSTREPRWFFDLSAEVWFDVD